MIKKVICCTLSFGIVMSGMSAFAFNAVADPDTKTVFVSGELCDGAQKAFLTVANPDVDIDNMTNYDNEISYVSSASASNAGIIGFSYRMPDGAPYGTYTVNINDGCGTKGHRITFDYRSEHKDLLAQFNAILEDPANDISDYESFMKTNGAAFAIDTDSASYTACRSDVWSAVKKNAPYQTVTELTYAFNRMTALYELNSADNVSDKQKALEKSLLYIDDEVAQRYKKLDKKFAEALSLNILNDTYTPENEVDELKKAILVQIINQCEKDTVKAAVEEYADELGIDISSTSKFAGVKKQQDIYLAIAGKNDFKGILEIKQYFDKLVSEALNSRSDNSSKSVGGSGGGISARVEPNFPTDNGTMNGEKEYFGDLKNVPWAVSAINAMCEKGILSGDGKGNFNPDRDVTREEFVKMMVAAFNIQKKEDGNKINFIDVGGGAWYADYIKAAIDNQIINGVSADMFGVGYKITREDMCVMLYRYLKDKISWQEIADTADKYSDMDDCSEYAREAVLRLSEKPVINGVGNGMFAPKETATRAMAAVIINRISALRN